MKAKIERQRDDDSAMFSIFDLRKCVNGNSLYSLIKALTKNYIKQYKNRFCKLNILYHAGLNRPEMENIFKEIDQLLEIDQ